VMSKPAGVRGESAGGRIEEVIKTAMKGKKAAFPA
jgi:hypothetical protein